MSKDSVFPRRIAGIAALLAVVALFSSQASEARRFAIVIGINQYADPTILQLQKAQQDAEDLAAVLASSGSFKSVKLMSGSLPYIDPLFPSRDNVITLVDQLVGILRPSDQVLFFFSGHGLNDSATGESYLLTIDAKARNFTGTALNLQRDVLSRFEAAGVGNVVALVDACQKSVTADKGLSVVGVDRVKSGAKAVVITATSPGKASYEDPQGSNGLFTKGLIAAFTGSADIDRNGELSVPELERWLPDTVSEYAFNANLSQSPVVYDSGDGVGQPSLGRTGTLVKAAAPAAKAAAVVPSAPSAAPMIGGPFTNGNGMVLVPVAGGTFTMSDYPGGQGFGCIPHRVSLSAFHMGQTEVTQAQYQKVMGTNPSKFLGETLPVDSVTWYDAVAFCNTLSQSEGKQAAYVINGTTVTFYKGANGYRLPTEAEWEYAAKGGVSGQEPTIASWSAFDWGPGKLNKIGWTGYNSFLKTHPVALLAANALDLYDMSGNVREWCQDWFDKDIGRTASDPTGPASSDTRSVRGVGWNQNGPTDMPFQFRGRAWPGMKSNEYGFRVVLPFR